MPATLTQAFTLLNPGPVNVSERVRRALAASLDQCHREPEYLDMQGRVREKLARAFGIADRYDVALLTGSGTAAMEAMVLSATGKGLLAIDNGVYGDRLALMAEARGIPCRRLKATWFERPSVDAVRALLRGGDLDTVAIVHHETTTGLLNDLPSVAAACREAGAGLLVDGVSSLGGEALDFGVVAPAALCCTANKCVQGLPGVSFVLVRKGTPLARRSVYLDLQNLLEKQARGDTPYTPAIQVTAALEAAVDELIEETVPGRIARYRRASTRIRRAAASLGVEATLPAALHSGTITSFRLPKGVTYERVHDRMREDGFVIYGGQGDLKRSAFRVANMGVIPDEALERFEVALRRAVT
jgi:2-aminoethylphosphonate-pyruvate transaminase